MNQKEIQTQIDAIRTELNRGDFDSYGQKEKVQAMVDAIYHPADALRDVRFQTLGQSMYAVSALSLTTPTGFGHQSTGKRRTLPMLRASKEPLYQFLRATERLGILHSLLLKDRDIRRFTDTQVETIMGISKDIQEVDGEIKKNVLLKVVAAYIFHSTMALWEIDDDFPFGVSAECVTFIQKHTHTDGSIDYRSMGEHFYTSLTQEEISCVTLPLGKGGPEIVSHKRPSMRDTLSITISMLYWSTDPSHERTSQKARGIQAIGDRPYDLWDSVPALFMSLDDATVSLTGELMQSLRMTFCPPYTQMDSLFQKGLFIRTCPDSPRPGALENIKAHSPVELLQGIRTLGRGMLDPSLPDYDPDGCLCIMPFINPACSAVMVVGHDEIVVGPSYDTVTAGGGSNITFTLNHHLQKEVCNMIKRMKLNDGMTHHELEFVWPMAKMGQVHMSPQGLFERLYKHSKAQHTSKPIITQVRGLEAEKESTAPAPVVNGEPLYIKGNIPTGTILQQNLIDVEQGDLSDCMELDQMVKDGSIPNDLVIYVSAGSTNCHAAGVALKNRLAIIYGQLPYDNGVSWTEINGWVTKQENVKPSPYDPSLFKTYYFKGCEDGDKFWQYGNVVLSQFFHTFIQKPRNDPRFEAYLAGVYSTWILKATLAVAMGEGRHAYIGQKATFAPVHGLIHIFLTTVFNKGDIFQWGHRSSYYHMFQNKEIGLENIHLAFEAYQRLFGECKWGGGSYGGTNYRESVEKGLAAAKAMLEFKRGEADLSVVLDAVNILENAVHNCSFFFNKFIHDKIFFEIGTQHHGVFRHIERQFHITAAFHYRFYNDIVDEPHVIWPTYRRMHKSTFAISHAILPEDNLPMEETMLAIKTTSNTETIDHLIEHFPRLMSYLNLFMSEMNGNAYCEDCDSHECGCNGAMSTTSFHHTGVCGLEVCNTPSCQHHHLANKYGMSPDDLEPLIKIFSHIKQTPYQSVPYTNEALQGNLSSAVQETSQLQDAVTGMIANPEGGWEVPNGNSFNPLRDDNDPHFIFSQDIEALGSHCHDTESTVFTTNEREYIGPSTEYKIYKDDKILEGMEGDWKAPLVFETGAIKVVHLAEMQRQVWKKWCAYFDTYTIKELIVDLAHTTNSTDFLINKHIEMESMLEEMHKSVCNNIAVTTYLTCRHRRTLCAEDWRVWDIEQLYKFYLQQYIMIRWNIDHSTILAYTTSPFQSGLTAPDIFQILLTKFDLDCVKEVLRI